MMSTNVTRHLCRATVIVALLTQYQERYFPNANRIVIRQAEALAFSIFFYTHTKVMGQTKQGYTCDPAGEARQLTSPPKHKLLSS